jgi:hypothetical protein
MSSRGTATSHRARLLYLRRTLIKHGSLERHEQISHRPRVADRHVAVLRCIQRVIHFVARLVLDGPTHSTEQRSDFIAHAMELLRRLDRLVSNV